MEIVEVNTDELEFDEAIEAILGVANIADYEDLPLSYKEDGLVGSIPAFRIVEGRKKCFAGRKYVLYAKAEGIKIIHAQQVDVSDSRVIQVAIKTNTTKHGSELIRAKMVAYLYDLYSVGSGYRSDLKGNEEEIELADDEKGGYSDDKKKGRRPTVYDKIGPMVGISAKKAMMLKFILNKNPGYFERIERERTSVYEAFTKCKEEAEGYTPAAPKEKEAVVTTDTTGVPKFNSGDSTADVNAVYEYITKPEGDTTTGSNQPGKKKMAVTTSVIYTTQKFVCPHCGEEIDLVVPKAENHEKAE